MSNQARLLGARVLRTVAVLACALVLVFASDHSALTQFSQNSYVGVSAGSANAQTITIPNIGSYDDILNQPITYTVTTGNTGPATLNGSSIGARNIYRVTPSGLSPLGGGETIANQRATVMWDGTQFQLLTTARPEAPGFVMDYTGASCPVGFFSANSQALSQTTYPALYAAVGTIWGPASGGNFTTPDLRNRTTYGQDQDVSGFTLRITTAAGNFDGKTVGAVGAVQNWTLTNNQVPVITPAGNVTTSTPTGSVSTSTPTGSVSTSTPTGSVSTSTPTGGVSISDTLTYGTVSSVFFSNGGGPFSLTTGGAGMGLGSVAVGVTGGSITAAFSGNPLTSSFSGNALTSSFSGNPLSSTFSGNPLTSSFSGAAWNPSGGQAHPTLSPGAIVNKCVRA